MTKKSELVQKLLKKVSPRAPLPKPLKDAPLLDQGMLCVLVRHMPQEKAEGVLEKLRKAYPDWNEMRVSQTLEIAAQIVVGERRGRREDVAAMLPPARDAREYLQEVYQKTHGFDLEFLKDDPAVAGKLVTQMPFLGLSGGSFLLWLATGRQLPVHGALVRVLDRLGLISRTASIKKARDVIEPLVPEGEDLLFVSAFGEVADRWCLPTKPTCHQCPLVDECPHGKKAFQEWKHAQVRLEAQRAKEEARRQALEKKEAEKRAREEARLAKKREIEEKRLARERDRLQRIELKKRAVEAREKAKADALAKKVAQAAAAAAKKAAQEAKAKAKKAEKTLKPKPSGAKKPARSGGKPKSKPAGRPTAKSGKKR